MSESKGTRGIRKTLGIAATGILVAMLLWILDALVYVLIDRKGALVDQLLRPAPSALVRWVVAAGFSAGIGVLAYREGTRRAGVNHALDEEGERYRRLVEHTPDAVFLQDETGILYANRSSADLLGAKDVQAVLGRTFWDFVPGEYKAFIEKRNRQILEEGREASPIEMKLLRLDGRQVEVEVMAIPHIANSRPVLQLNVHDITSRKWVEEQIRQRNIELTALNAVAETVSQTLQLDRVLNESLGCVLGLDILGGHGQGMIFLREEGSQLLELAAHRGAPEKHPCLAQAPHVGECLCGLAVQGGVPILSEDCYHDERHTRVWPDMPRHKDVCLPLRVHGRIIGAMDVRVPPDRVIDDNVLGLLTSVADQISVAIENARLFEEVRHQSETLRALSARFAEVEEAERRRLARELHDQVGEGLTALGINLNILRTQLAKEDGEPLSRYLVDCLALVEKTTERIRNVMAELRPPMLDDYGLMATLRWYARQYSNRVGVGVEVSGDEPAPRLPPSVESALFRIMTEALTNVAKHARASRVWVTVEADERTLVLKISDDGIGFDMDRPHADGQETGWGLLTMAERAEAAGGRFRIESNPTEGGTRVLVEVPR